MRHFELIEPTTMDEACLALAAETDAKPVAGGTALLTVIKQGLLHPRMLVNLKKVGDGSVISFDPQRGLRIGGLATLNEIEISSLVRQHCPVLAEACHQVANIRIRNMATIGGNLAHADAQSDPPTLLAALDVRLEIMSAGARRDLSLSDFQRGIYETALLPGELLSAVIVPPLPPGMIGRYIKFTTGSWGERPCVGIAAFTQIESGICRELRLAVGAVSPRPVRIASGEKRARNQPLTIELIQSVAADAAKFIKPIDDLRGSAAYKRHLVRILAQRAIAAMANGARELKP